MKRFPLLTFLFMAISFAAAQDSSMPGMNPEPAPLQQPKAPHQGHDMQNMPGMSPNGPQHAHVASGTSVEPASTPANMWMIERHGWMLMAHGNVFLTGNFQGGPRGDKKFESMNWAMFLEHHALGRGTIEFHQMLSAEPATVPSGGGFPELFQTGEAYRGRPLVDRQHPHDVFGELAALYTLPLGKHASWQLYGAPVGEPALGPVAFMHRASAAEIPSAPLGHHQEDSTHISYGVITTGISFYKFKIEGSAFNGREPDEHRLTFDFGPLDSLSTRLSFAPAKNWSAQYSFGRLIHQEALEPGNTQRQTASISYNRPLERGNWSSTFVYGQAHKLINDSRQDSWLLESVVNFRDRNYAFTRLEYVDRDELTGAPVPPNRTFKVGAYTFGGVRDLIHNEKLQVGLGADVTLYSKPAELNAAYGEHPVSAAVFLRIRPGSMKH